MRKKIVSIAVIGAVLVTGALAARYSPAGSELAYVVRHASLASALVAHDLCYGVLLQERSEADVRAHELGPLMDERLSWFKADIDPERGSVRASLLGLFRQEFGLRADGSCSPGVSREASAPPAMPEPDPRPWPQGDGVYPGAHELVADIERLAEAVEAEFHPFPSGMGRGTRSVLIIHQGRLVYERHAPGWDRFIPQNGQSNTKVLTALLAGMLIDEGRISLDQAGLHSEWRDGRADITLRHLLRMESGLAWNESNVDGDPGVAKLLADSASGHAAALPLRDPPGIRFSYSGGDSELAMAALQEASGLNEEEWADYPYQTLFEPLGMRRAVISRDASGRFVAQGSMHAAAVDWARLGLFLARDGVWDGARILPEGWTAFITTPTASSQCNYAAQLWIRGGCTDSEPSPVFELSGFMGQSVTVVPASDTVIVRTGFAPWNTGDLLERVFPALGIDAPTRMAMEERQG